MDIESMTAELAVCNESIAQIMGQLDTLRGAITDEAKPIIRNAIQQAVEDAVKKNAEHTVALGRERLTEVKTKLNEILAGSDQFLDELSAQDKYWGHVGYQLYGEYPSDYMPYDKKERIGSNIRDLFRIAYGQAGTLLAEYEYVKLGYESDHYSEWIFRSYDDFKTAKARNFPALPKEFVSLITQYTDMCKDLHKKLFEQHGIQKNIAAAEAQNLWDNI